MNSIDETTKGKIITLITALIPYAKIYLFGSRARGTQLQWSDIDLALDSGKKLPIEQLGEIISILAATNIPYKIEVVDWYRISSAMREAIQQEGILWKSQTLLYHEYSN